jgi:hypothetical protein
MGGSTQNCATRIGGAIAVSALVFVLNIGAGRIAHPTPYDPVLLGPSLGPCNPGLAGPDFIAGTDIYGTPVVPADANVTPLTVGMASETAIPEVLTHLPNLDRVRVNVQIKGLAAEVARAGRAGCGVPESHGRNRG